MSMKNSSDTIGNRTRDLPACSAVPQPTAPPRAPVVAYRNIILSDNCRLALPVGCLDLVNPGVKQFVGCDACLSA